ncbi:alpha/beta hydrolase [Nonlabens ponticola]|uniref:Alpha/beta hydrolase n=1 Tax=Nonlabens ponticola TaxID=2496866 RepID=A0A3S9MWW3_9FLAO|nr:alpha/beta hydrolase [Nonlabens ponticola]AZQ43670.1 alpha/beta hydrolase [Nonlabens ponticola]
MKKFLLLFLFPAIVFGQDAFSKKPAEKESTLSTDVTINEDVKGTLLMPENQANKTLVILLTGSGPNDRDGNSMMTKNDSHKQLAQALQKEGIATYRYDKRTATRLKERRSVDDIKFQDFVTDASSVINHFVDDKRFDKIYMAGHSQGSLVAMLALNDEVDGFISIAGPGETIDKSIIQQVGAQSPGLDKQVETVFNKMKAQDSLVTDYPAYLNSIFNPSLQPFMKEWMSHDPALVISKLELPVLIVNGDQDTQIDIKQAKLLHTAAPQADYYIIKDMNHVLKKVGSDPLENAKSYSDPNFPLHEELVQRIVDFVK